MIAALSGRALAAAARRSGYRPLVADLFADLDTRSIAEAVERVDGSLAHGFFSRSLLRSLDRLAEGRRPIGVVYASGFERRHPLLGAMRSRYGLLGNSPETVATVADPARFAALCRAADVAHPEIGFDAAPDGGWLEKRSGGAGGAHVRRVRPGRVPRRGHYLQRRVDGRAVSALFLADGHASRTLGLSEQFAAPSPGHPFRYGGALRPAAITPEMAGTMAQAIERLVTASGLVGLNSADFLAREDAFTLLEINPRPGATLDIFAHPDLFDLHVQACRGALPPVMPTFAGARAASVVYVPVPCVVAEGFAWPEWASDRQPPGIAVPAEGPLCTVQAEADNAATVRKMIQERTETMLALAGVRR